MRYFFSTLALLFLHARLSAQLLATLHTTQGDVVVELQYAVAPQAGANFVTHTPYVLSMANSGPNTNGSQIFLTGSLPLNDLDFIHTDFGPAPRRNWPRCDRYQSHSTQAWNGSRFVPFSSGEAEISR